jgi:phage-related protein
MHGPALPVTFFRLDSGREPVRLWLKGMSPADRRIIGEDIKTLQLGWPIGMPLARKVDAGLWELRSRTTTGIARVFFTVPGNRIVLLHGFVKKTGRTPIRELALARRRLSRLGRNR